MWRRGLVSLVATLLASGTALAQTGSITGVVTSSEGAAPVVGAHVEVVGTTVGAVTGDNGRYTIVVRPGTYALRATRIGFAPATVSGVVVTAGATVTANIRMQAAATKLSGVVVVGYGEQRARDVTGAVSTVTPREFNTGRIISPQQLITAKVPGVQVVGSNEPGGGIAVRIRGGSSVTSSNEPLYVVDGFPLPVGGGISAGRDPLNFLNPQDIETVTVLKDASATAIYGSRGANGVVIITTKSGRQGPQVTYTGSVSESNVISQPSLLNAAQFRAAVAQYAPSNVAILGNASTNWLDAVQHSAVGQEHTIAVAGNKQDMNYRLSLGYLDQGGVLRGTTAKRISTSLNYSDRLLNRRLDVQASVIGSRTNDWFTPGAVLDYAARYAPTQPIMSAPGTYFQWTDPLAPGNPVAELALVTDQGSTYRSVGNLQGTYHAPFLSGLSTTMVLGYDVAKADRTTFYPSNEFAQIMNSTGGNINRNSPTQVNTLLDAYATYARPSADKRSRLELTAGYEYQRFRADYATLYAQGLSSNLLGIHGVPTATLQRNSIYDEESRLISGFARLNATLNERYLLTLSVRRDGSSKFGPTHQWGVFPAAAVAWRIVNAPLDGRLSALSDLKLRLSWGVNGNQAFPNYQAFSAYTIGNAQAQAQFGNQFVSTIRPSAADPNIRWEQTTSNDVGLDYGFFNNRVTGTVDYYFKKTKDLIFNVPIAAGTNLSNYLTTNIGSLQNRGLELGLSALLLDGSQGGVTWNADFTASTNSNKLLQITATSAGGQQILTGGIAGGVGTNIEVLQPGYPVNSFFVYRHRTGANGQPVTGDTTDIALYRDVNGDGIINQSDRVPYKNPAPKWIFGHSSQIGFHNFDLSYTMRAYVGNYVYNNVASNLGSYSALTGKTPVNLSTSALQYNFRNPQYFSDLYVQKASFLRMDNISLGYTFHGLRSLQQLRLFGTVQNVFTITPYKGVDPEAGLNGIDYSLYPRARTFTFGTNIGF